MVDLVHPLADNAGFALNSSQLGEVRVVNARADLTIEPTQADVLHMCKLAAQHTVADLILLMTDMDTVADLVVDVGILDTIQDPADTTDPNLFIAASTLGQGVLGSERMALKAGFELAAVNYDRIITVTWTTDAATFAAGSLGLQVHTRAVQNQEGIIVLV